jgi:HSP20 family molecular chaperone IbpA
MRYRRLSVRYAMTVRSARSWPFADVWESDRLRLLAQARWRPEADMVETASAVQIVVDLAGVGEDDFEVQLFQDAVVVGGRRRLPACEEDAIYHAAGIRQGAFQLELALPSPIDAERVEAQYDRGILRITLPKRSGPA